MATTQPSTPRLPSTLMLVRLYRKNNDGKALFSINVTNCSMNPKLNALQNLSRLVGENAILKDRGRVAVIQIQRIIIKPELIEFVLKPKRGRHLGLNSLRLIYVCSSPEYLELNGSRFICSLLGWFVETDPAKVAAVTEMIVNSADIYDVFRTLNGRRSQ